MQQSVIPRMHIYPSFHQSISIHPCLNPSRCKYAYTHTTQPNATCLPTYLPTYRRNMRATNCAYACFSDRSLPTYVCIRLTGSVPIRDQSAAWLLTASAASFVADESMTAAICGSRRALAYLARPTNRSQGLVRLLVRPSPPP